MSDSPKLALCTIVAKNYISSARVLCASFKAAHPEADCYVLIIDDFRDFIDPSKESFEVISPSVLSKLGDWNCFSFKYNVIELATAVKPFLMEYLIRKKGAQKLLYIDPDIMVFNPMPELLSDLDNADIVITPHVDTDFPDDGKTPDAQMFYLHGIYNLGFIGVRDSETTTRFLNWWQSKLQDHCIIDLSAGYFVDQKFIDLVPTIFDGVYIEKSHSYNVAYWNLHSRFISKTDGVWICNGKPLGFFHFSSYNPTNPDLITKPIAYNRSKVSDQLEMAPLFEEYRTALEASGFAESRSWSYSLNFFDSGEAISQEIRTWYRHKRANWADYGNPFVSEELKAQARKFLRKRQIIDIRVRLALKTRLKRLGVFRPKTAQTTSLS